MQKKRFYKKVAILRHLMVSWFILCIFWSEIDCAVDFEVKCAKDKAFSYNASSENGPCNWPKINPNCGGKFQSPISLNTKKFLILERKKPIRFRNFCTKPVSAEIVNDGHTAMITMKFPNKQKPQVSGRLLNEQKYNFEQLHLHWGSENDIGSEHMLDGVRYPMEMHLLFRIQKCPSVEVADVRKVSAYVVFSFLFEICDEALNFKTISKISQLMQKIEQPGVLYKMKPCEFFRLTDIFENDFDFDFITYKGSLTTPPCTEPVTWILPMKILKTSPAIMECFRDLKDLDGEDITDNFRPLQELNRRKVRFYMKPPAD